MCAWQARVGYFGPGGEYIYSLTHTETFALWFLRPFDDTGLDDRITSHNTVRQTMAEDVSTCRRRGV